MSATVPAALPAEPAARPVENEASEPVDTRHQRREARAADGSAVDEKHRWTLTDHLHSHPRSRTPQVEPLLGRRHAFDIPVPGLGVPVLPFVHARQRHTKAPTDEEMANAPCSSMTAAARRRHSATSSVQVIQSRISSW